MKNDNGKLIKASKNNSSRIVIEIIEIVQRQIAIVKVKKKNASKRVPLKRRFHRFTHPSLKSNEIKHNSSAL